MSIAETGGPNLASAAVFWFWVTAGSFSPSLVIFHLELVAVIRVSARSLASTFTVIHA